MTTVTPPREERASAGRFARFAKKFKFDSHHEIERFRVVIALITALGVAIIGGSAFAAYKSKQVDISGTAQYTQFFTTSYTQQDGALNGVYANSDKTRAVALFSFDGVMSRNPNDYEVFITGMNGGKPTRVESAMTAKLVSFGDNAHMGLIMDAPEGFAMQILNVTVSAKRNLASPAPMSAEDMAAYGYAGDTFTTRDSWRMIMNPAATQAPVVPELDAYDFDPRSFLINTVYRDREVALRRAADDTLVAMRTAQERIGFYHDALADTQVNVKDGVGATLVMPAPPKEIAGDKVDGMSREELSSALMAGEEIPAIEEKSQKARELDTYEDGTLPTTYELITRSAVRGGVQYDWRASSVEEGYLKQLMPAGYDPQTYIGELRARSKDAKAPEMDTKFMLSTGKSLDSYDATDKALMSLRANAMNLVSSYQDFYQAKAQYQANDLVALLALEAELDDVAEGTTVSTTAENITVNR